MDITNVHKRCKMPHDPTRNGPDCERNKRRKTSQAGTKKRPDFKKLARKGFFEVPPEDKDYLKVISEAREKFETCAVPSMPCIPKEECPEKPLVLSMFCCSGKPDATLISNSSASRTTASTPHAPYSLKKICV